MKKISITFIILFTFTFILPQGVLGIGQMTKPMIFGDVLKGQTVKSELILYNSEKSEVIYKLKADGEIEDWTSFYSLNDLKTPIAEINIPAESNIKAIAKFTVPEDALNGEYKGEVAIISMPEKNESEEGSNVSVGMRVGRQVSITVTGEEIIEFDASITPKSYLIKENEPLQINAVYYNAGNVEIKPDLQFRILKDDQLLFNAIFPYPENEEGINPLTSKKITVEWPTSGASNGKYLAEAKALLNNEIKQEDDFSFIVGSLEQGNTYDGGITSIITKIGGGNIVIGWILLGTVFLLLMIIFIHKKGDYLYKKIGLKRNIKLIKKQREKKMNSIR